MVGKDKQRQPFLGYGSLENKVIEKIIFRKLQDSMYPPCVDVPLWGTIMAANNVSTRNEAANEINIPNFSSHLYR